MTTGKLNRSGNPYQTTYKEISSCLLLSTVLVLVVFEGCIIWLFRSLPWFPAASLSLSWEQKYVTYPTGFLLFRLVSQEWAKQALPGLLQGPSIDRYCGDQDYYFLLIHVLLCIWESWYMWEELLEASWAFATRGGLLLYISYKCMICCVGYGFQAF